MELNRKRPVYSGACWLTDLKCKEFSGKHKIFTRLAPADFELLVNLVGLKIVKEHHIPGSCSGSRETGRNIAILGLR